MCEQPTRSWREFAPLPRVVYAMLAVCSLLAGVVAGQVLDSPAAAWALVFVGGALLAMAVAMPVVQKFEFGLPVAFKVVAAVRGREASIRSLFDSQRPELELCAQLLCRDPARAAALIETAWSQLTFRWRRPVGPAMRLYAWCLLLHLLVESERLVADPSMPAERRTPLDALDHGARVVVVLRSFANLSFEEMSTLLGRPPWTIEAELQAAELVIAKAQGAM